MPPIDQHRQANAMRTTVIDERVHGGPYGSSGEEDVIDQDQRASFNIKRQIGFFDFRLGCDVAHIVTVEGDVENAHGNVLARFFAEELGNSSSQVRPPCLNADQRQF